MGCVSSRLSTLDAGEAGKSRAHGYMQTGRDTERGNVTGDNCWKFWLDLLQQSLLQGREQGRAIIRMQP